MNIPLIDNASAMAPARSPAAVAGAGAAGAPASFGETLARAVDAVNTLQLQAQEGAQSLASGTAANIHDVTIALEQANITLQLTATVRNKAVEAYQEIMRMQI